MANREAHIAAIKPPEALLSISLNFPPVAIASLEIDLGLVNSWIILVNDFMAAFPRMIFVKVRPSMADSIDVVWQDLSHPVRIAVRHN